MIYNQQKKNFTLPFNPVFLILWIVKLFEVLPKRNGYFFVSESFALNGYIFVASTNKKDLDNLFDCVKLMGYLASAVNVVSSNPRVGSLPRIKYLPR